MGKTRHQKFVKSEKSKVKLKGKKELPKGTNVTNTAFKIKKIVIREQLKGAAPGAGGSGAEPLSRTRLGVRELLARLQHFNISSRTEGLTGLREVIAGYAEGGLAAHLGQLLQGVAPLVLDREKNVRRESYKVLHEALSRVPEDKIAPFFAILSSYLRCAMTHIDTRIHEDSLLYFDILLTCSPSLVASNIHKILPSFLDMISKLRIDSKPGRTLMVNLGSKMTTVKWRTKVLSRLLQFLQTFFAIKSKANGSLNADIGNAEIFERSGNKQCVTDCTHYYGKEITHYSLYKEIEICKLSCFSKDRVINPSGETEGDKLKNYAEALLPLLLDSWREVRPTSVVPGQRVESVLSEEAVTLLNCILHIILLLWKLAQIVDSDLRTTQVSQWFIKKYCNDFTHTVFDSFPYTFGGTKANKKKTSVNTKSAIQGLDEKCLEENLLICQIYIILNGKIIKGQQPQAGKVLNYVKWSVDHMTSDNHSCQNKVIEIVQTLLLCENWTEANETVHLLDRLIIEYFKIEQRTLFKRGIFVTLCRILLNNSLATLRSTQLFKDWLSKLPDAICESDSIPEILFDIINRFAIQNTQLFNQSVKGKLKLIVQKLPHLNITGVADKEEAKRRAIGLLYWVDCWDNECLNVLQDQLQTAAYSGDAKQYLVDVLKLKTDGMFSQ